jgi:molybdenum cofactor guanylyltransferase
MSRPHTEPIGVILAGGRGRRMGGAKTTVLLKGRPLISYPLEAVSAALAEVVVLAKAQTELPSLPGTTVWIESEPVHHPAIGILQALGLAGGRPVLVCASDLPFVTPELVRELASSDPEGAPAVVASARGSMQPLLGCYLPRAARLMLAGDERPLREQIAALDPRIHEVDDPRELFNVNAPEDLLQAAAMLDRQAPTRK